MGITALIAVDTTVTRKSRKNVSANVGGSVMTREEAIEILEEVKVMDDSMYAYNDSYLAALDMAIGALKAQHDYETSVEVVQYCERYEPAYNPEDGSM